MLLRGKISNLHPIVLVESLTCILKVMLDQDVVVGRASDLESKRNRAGGHCPLPTQFSFAEQ